MEIYVDPRKDEAGQIVKKLTLQSILTLLCAPTCLVSIGIFFNLGSHH